MTDDRSALGARLGAAEEAARESRHEVLRELLGAYADGELPPETMAQIDAHLVGCVECRRVLDVHGTIRSRLAAERPAAATPAFRARITAALDAVPAPAIARPTAPRPQGLPRRTVWLAVAGWVVALLLGAALLAQGGAFGRIGTPVRGLAVPIASVPLLGGVAEDFARVSRGDLPGRARDLSAVRAAVSFPVEPLRAPNLRLLAAWTANIRGEPAAVLAYRLDDRLVVQYIFADDAFFRNPAVRNAVADRHLLAARSGPSAIAAWPQASPTGTVLVGDVPLDSFRTIWRMESSH